MTTHPTLRCAIYTRKSSDEGLEQDFNSLDAQHEACAAYVASQRHEGWKLVSERFDDGGISGGTLERPALQRLLAEVNAGRISMIVVYKIDRLTRSLADFAKLVERLEAKGASFVSVTQSFNTSTSMGRLTLNVLLSFAQFEREVTAERIRDKIAASKKKGLWMGGTIPLGYDRHPDPQRRELVVNESEAETVGTLFQLYADLGCLRRVEEEANRRGLRSKLHHYTTGRSLGGGPFSRGQLHYLLTNPVYLGHIRHHDKIWPGQHRAIVPQGLWDRVQAALQAKSKKPRRQGGTEHTARLTGLFRDETGDRLTPSHAIRKGRRYHYYVSNRLIGGGTDPTGWRLPAVNFEAVVAGAIADHLDQAAEHHSVLAHPIATGAEALSARLRAAASDLRSPRSSELSAAITQGRLTADAIRIDLDVGWLSARLQVPSADLAPAMRTVDCPIGLRRRGVEIRIVTGRPIPAPDQTLIRALGRAHHWVNELRRGKPLHEIARADGVTEALIRVRAPLAFLSPRLQERVLAGTLPAQLTLDRILRIGIPLAWAEQEHALGIAS